MLSANNSEVSLPYVILVKYDSVFNKWVLKFDGKIEEDPKLLKLTMIFILQVKVYYSLC